MGVKAVNYCVSDDDVFKSMQVIVGNDEREVKLRKHGGSGGTCRQWRLADDDYIRMIQYTWNNQSFCVTQVVFKSHFEQTRVFGRGNGTKINYEYTAFQPFIGFYTQEIDDTTTAIGAYEDDCHGAPAKLPFGFETFNVPSMEEVEGENSVASVTWVNERHGEAAEEAVLLDKIEEVEKEEDTVVEDNEEDHIANKEFEKVEITIDIEEPPTELDTRPSEPAPETTSRVSSTTVPEEPTPEELEAKIYNLEREIVERDNVLAMASES